MGWVDVPDDGNTDRFPVDTLVKKLKEAAGEIDLFCQDYHGQTRKCCDGIRACFATMEESFSSVKVQAIGNQNMHKACRKLSTDLRATNSCTVSWTGQCHNNVNAEHLAKPFNDTLDKLLEIINENCNDLPSERTTTTATTTTTTPRKTSSTSTITSVRASLSPSSSTTTMTTTSTITTTTKTTTTTTTTQEEEITVFVTTPNGPEETSQTLTEEIRNEEPHVSSAATHVSPTSEPGIPDNPNNNRPDSSPGTSAAPTVIQNTTSTARSTSSSNSSSDSILSTASISSSAATSPDLSWNRTAVYGGLDGDSTIIIIPSVVGGLLLMCAISICTFILYKKRQSTNSDSGGSLETAGKRGLFEWLFKPPKTTGSVHTDTEIYAEIDEAFMEAVYRYDKEKPNIVRERIPNSQFNICYESSFNSDAIIASKDTITSKATETSIVTMEPLSPLALIRKDDDAITSFQIDQSKFQKLQDGKDNGSTVLSNQKGFLTRRPGFTDIRSDSSGGDYVYIEAMPNDVFEDEQIYAVPSFEESEYDTAEYGRNPQRNISQAPEQNYNSVNMYTNVERTSFQGNIPDVQQNVKEYRRHSSDQDIDEHLYENQDTLMEY